jgi:hypothetical protein
VPGRYELTKYLGLKLECAQGEKKKKKKKAEEEQFEEEGKLVGMALWMVQTTVQYLLRRTVNCT